MSESIKKPEIERDEAREICRWLMPRLLAACSRLKLEAVKEAAEDLRDQNPDIFNQVK